MVVLFRWHLDVNKTCAAPPCVTVHQQNGIDKPLKNSVCFDARTDEKRWSPDSAAAAGRTVSESSRPAELSDSAASRITSWLAPIDYLRPPRLLIGSPARTPLNWEAYHSVSNRCRD